MLYYALVFLLIAILAAVFGFGGVAIVSAGIAKILFFVFIVLFLVYRNAAYHEEKLLLSRYPDYRTYQERAWRFIPFLY